MDRGYLLQCSQCGSSSRVPTDQAERRGKCGRCGAGLIASNSLPIEVTDASWDEEVLGSEAATIVEVWSPLCTVCAQYELSVRQMAASLYGRARVLQLNAEENPRTAERYGVRGVPTVLLFRGGELLAALPGPQGERGLRERLGI